MKKKGRILGTIGWILSLAIVGGVLVYGAMFDRHTVGKAAKPLGASTGNIVSAFTKKEGLDETKALIDNTASAVFAAPAADAKYTSFTVKMTMKGVDTTEVGKAYSDIECVLYSDASYTYVKFSNAGYLDRTTMKIAAEFAYAKESGEFWLLDNSGVGGQCGTSDTAYLDKATWSKAENSALLDFTEVLEPFVVDNASFSIMNGMFTFEDKATKEAAGLETANVSFTLGYAPVVSYTMGVKDSTAYYSLAYSNLNNTKVELPESLKTAIGKEA